MSNTETSDRQFAANRANALKSTGPRTPDGKQNSAFNAWKHGITASKIILSTEDEEIFAEIRKGYHQRLVPIDIMECDLVDDIVHVRWQIRRIRGIEDSIYEIEVNRPDLIKGFDYAGNTIRTALGHIHAAENSSALALANRQLARLSRELDRLFNTLNKLRRDNPPAFPLQPVPVAPAEDAPVQNEPIPISEQPAAEPVVPPAAEPLAPAALSTQLRFTPTIVEIPKPAPPAPPDGPQTGHRLWLVAS